MKKISEKLKKWYNLNARDLVFRQNKNPYSIWLSEIIMQQTRIEQGLPYYLKFIVAYPTVQDLSNATEAEVLKLWQGLGYYSRGRNLLKCAKIINQNYKGIFPQTAVELAKLPGIGKYTSAAISSIAFEEPVPSIDGNMIRVGSRLVGIKEEFPGRIAMEKLEFFLNKFIQTNKPSIINQALMELGALVCKPNNPLCTECPFNNICEANINNTWDIIPLKKAKKKPKELHLNFLDIHIENKTYLVKRNSDSIWANLYEYPNFEGEIFDLEIALSKVFESKNRPIIVNQTKMTHILTHRKIMATFWEISLKSAELNKKNNIFELEKSELKKFPIHRLMDKYIKKNDK